MYTTTNSSSFAQQSQAATDFYWGMNSAYRAVRKIFGNFAGYYILAPIIVGLIWLLLYSFKRRLKRALSTNISLSDYKKIRLEYDRLNKIFEKNGDKTLSIDLSKSPFLLRGSLRLFIDILNIIKQRRDAIALLLKQLDDESPKTDLLQPALEKDLWESRAKVYEYRF